MPVWLRPLSIVLLLFSCDAAAGGGWWPSPLRPFRGPVWLRSLALVLFRGNSAAVARGGGVPLCGLSGGLFGCDMTAEQQENKRLVAAKRARKGHREEGHHPSPRPGRRKGRREEGHHPSPWRGSGVTAEQQ